MTIEPGRAAYNLEETIHQDLGNSISHWNVKDFRFQNRRGSYGSPFTSEIDSRNNVRPRLSVQDVENIFHRQLRYELHSFINESTDNLSNRNTDDDLQEEILAYEPILGYENLAHISSHSRATYTSYQIISRFDELQRAIKSWDLLWISKILNNAQFDRKLEIFQDDQSDDDGNHRRIIKRMIIENIESIAQPLQEERDVKEKELNLIILLNSL